MMVFALEASLCIDSACRDSKSLQLSVMRSIGLSRLGRTAASACSKLVLGLFLHSASRAKPKEVSASPYMTCSPALPTEYPNSHMTVSMGSGRCADCAAADPSGEPTISFSYLSQLKVARLICAAREASGIRQA